ncbi:MAG: phytanoyl-CoA dioxygenase family protein [Candidatus Latescibacteria bacterium]|nr:phytanoyl-CoA dioxygenase family protein [Candidatus Latescibacterota bacterium]
MANKKLKLTPQQERQFEEDGFFLVEEALSPPEIAELLAVIDELDGRYRRERNLGPHESFQMRNIVALHPVFKKVMDHPGMLPLVVDLMGFNIQLRTSHMDVRPSQVAAVAEKELGSAESFFPWHADQPDYGWPLVDGVIPFMEMKIGYYLTDLTQHNSGAICVVRGSHRTSPWLGGDRRNGADPARIVEVNVRPGTALVWRTALCHCVSPNLSGQARKCLYYGYHPRWIRPSDFEHQDPAVLEGCTLIQLQLLGELGTGKKNYAGDDEAQPVSRYWRPRDEDIPLKAWAEALRQGRAEEANP